MSNKQIQTEAELAALAEGTAVVWHWKDADVTGLVDQKQTGGGWSKSNVSARAHWWDDENVTCHVVYSPADFAYGMPL